MRAIPERLRDASRGGAIQIDYLYLLPLLLVRQADNDGESLVGDERLRRAAAVERDRRRRHQDSDLCAHVPAAQLPVLLPQPHTRQRLLRGAWLRHRHGQQTATARPRGINQSINQSINQKSLLHAI